VISNHVIKIIKENAICGPRLGWDQGVAGVTIQRGPIGRDSWILIQHWRVIGLHSAQVVNR